MCYIVYILYSHTLNVYYKGQTDDLDDRINRHNHGFEKATKCGIPWELVWYTKKTTRSEAILLEAKLKNLNRERLIRFIEHHKVNITDPKTLKTHVAGPDDP